MAELQILEFPDPRLRTVAQPVTVYDADLQGLVADMLRTMYTANGIGLAATQVDRHVRLLVLDVSESRDQPREYINPEIISREGEQVCEEGCLSVPGVYANVERAEHIRIRARDRHGIEFEEDASGLHAVCLQHEMDHLEGRLFVDYLSPLKRQMVRKRLAKQRRQAVQESAVGPAL
ncbi:MAG: peptide deformylase [Xanthomonadales bacterium]|nr:peptide deformylase [Xanthomonadales bacterium]NIN60138.1 peptide deformylase [Xanthomonadales bacterium]NIN74285.1 peptide deformylase [Xanthomonadales bacterium]NIO12794.1 peptide deformylase [Xanthomonadales bacterium]NIP12531.1 peptide deformylase [Xanthomonadales bacterium]